MKYLKRFEEIIPEVNPIEFVAPTREHPSYKNEAKKRKRKKIENAEMKPVMTPPNHTKDVISFKGKP